MKKIIGFILGFFLGIFLLFPLLLDVDLHHSMNMNKEVCIEHCLFEALSHTEDISISTISHSIFWGIKIVLNQLFEEVFLVSSLIFFIIKFIPPGEKYTLKNADYINLMGIIKSTT